MVMDKEQQEKVRALAPFALAAEKALHGLEPFLKKPAELVLMLVNPGHPDRAFLMTRAGFTDIRAALDYFESPGEHEVSREAVVDALNGEGS
jgi:hypothetical protein